MKAKLEGIGIPYREIKCYGSQVVITALCEGTAERWSMLLTKIGLQVRRIVGTYQENQENRGTVCCPTRHKVWMVGAVAKGA